VPAQTAGVTARLRATGVPTRVLWASDDAYLPVETVGRPLAEALGAELRVVSGGHFVPAENAAGVARELIDWLT
jgi:pimeloyl-ACP methyl ester carboxylesterase